MSLNEKIQATCQYVCTLAILALFAHATPSVAGLDQQTLLNFITKNDDRLKQIEKHGVKLPSQVFLLAKAALPVNKSTWS